MENVCIQTVTLDMHHQQQCVEWSIAKTLACNFSAMWAQIKKKNCHSQSALRQRSKREVFAFRAWILIKDLFLSAFPVSWPSLSSLGWGQSKLAWQIPLNSPQVFAYQPGSVIIQTSAHKNICLYIHLTEGDVTYVGGHTGCCCSAHKWPGMATWSCRPVASVSNWTPLPI